MILSMALIACKCGKVMKIQYFKKHCATMAHYNRLRRNQRLSLGGEPLVAYVEQDKHDIS
jgi:hypothetical protein